MDRKKTVGIGSWVCLLVLFTTAGLPSSLGAQNLTLLCEESPPSQFKNPDGSLSGFAVELIQELQRRLGTSETLRMANWAGAYDLLLREPNVALFSMTKTKEREKLFQWVGPINQGTQGLWALKRSRIRVNSLEDARKLPSIGVYTNDFRDQYLSARGYTNLDRAPSAELNYRKLKEGRVSVIVTARRQLSKFLPEIGLSMESVEEVLPVFSVQDYIAFSAGTPASLVQKWQRALDSTKSDGTFAALFAKWYPGETAPMTPLPPEF